MGSKPCMPPSDPGTPNHSSRIGAVDRCRALASSGCRCAARRCRGRGRRCRRCPSAPGTQYARPRRAVGREVVADLADVARVAHVEEAHALLVPADGGDAVAVVEPVRRAVGGDRRLGVLGVAAGDEAVELGLPRVDRSHLALAAWLIFHVSNLPWPLQLPGCASFGVDVVLLGDEQRVRRSAGSCA